MFEEQGMEEGCSNSNPTISEADNPYFDNHLTPIFPH